MRRRTHARKLAFYRRQNGCCWLCGEPLDLFLPAHAIGSASWEHIIPASSGGSDGWRNMALTHYECNRWRGKRFIFKVERPRNGCAPPKEKYLRVGFEIAMRKLRRILERTAPEVSDG